MCQQYKAGWEQEDPIHGACTTQGRGQDYGNKERAAETNSNVDSSAQPSVAQLAGRFREQAAVARETPANRPARRRPPCSLPLFPPKVELGQNGEEKSPYSTSHPPKIKVKSSPLIEKLQANLAFDPAALLPGASPKSPGLKAIVSPFHSPPSTPSSPGIRSQPGEAEEVPVSFDQPPEGTHLPSYTKVRTRGSIKRRPPSRQFRRSQSDCGDLGDYRAVEPSQENGTREENGDDVFPGKNKAPGSPPPNQEALGDGVEGPLGSAEKAPRRSNSLEKPEEQVGTPEEASAGDKAGQNPDTAGQGGLEAPEPPQTCSAEAEKGTAAGEHTDTEKATEGTASEESVADEEEGSGQKSADAKTPEAGAVREKAPQSSPGRVEGTVVPELETKQKERASLEPGCSPGVDGVPGETSNEIQNDHEVSTDDIPIEDTRM
ncbi:capZ-interacting protein isoform X1 [Peromyscus maniculatus bairdii]|uniref:capZ-interacting protein isoform X1 n=1 Tax=Peromyscus maniculatus bairdii TaxID=230844 RepID=UPI001C2EDEC3|nr:capZ-interacting protein isoform X1 [Peromyscus maniculatus bairdii]XP_042114439.1 capZ-interacting protein isoform X1 [Peromyscus maniculatus bairdii]